MSQPTSPVAGSPTGAAPSSPEAVLAQVLVQLQQGQAQIAKDTREGLQKLSEGLQSAIKKPGIVDVNGHWKARCAEENSWWGSEALEKLELQIRDLVLQSLVHGQKALDWVRLRGERPIISDDMLTDEISDIDRQPRPSDETLRAILLSMVPENLEEHLELNFQRFDSYSKMRSEEASFLKQKASKNLADSGGAVPMEIDYVGGKGNGSKDKAKVCFNGHKPGHISKDCWHKSKGQPSSSSSKGSKGQSGKGSKGSDKGSKGSPKAKEKESPSLWITRGRVPRRVLDWG